MATVVTSQNSSVIVGHLGNAGAPTTSITVTHARWRTLAEE
jgi:hypothetical protein